MKEVILYHGSYLPIDTPSLERCENGKDFGRGFYLTSSKKQAERFCKSSVGKALKNGKIHKNQNIGYVSVFKAQLDGSVSVHEFEKADKAWLKCVSGHRKEDLFADEIEKWRDYDVIVGKIANDTTNVVITNYMNGDYGSPEEDSAIQFAISLLRTDKLVDQFCFRSEKALECLQYETSYEVVIK